MIPIESKTSTEKAKPLEIIHALMIAAVRALNSHPKDGPTILDRVSARIDNLKRPADEHIENQT